MNANPLKVEAEEITTKREAMSILRAMQPEDAEPITEEQAIIRYARRALALYKDRKRVEAGKAARIYTPRVLDALPAKVRRAAAALVEALPAARPEEKPEPKKASKPAPAAKPAKPAKSEPKKAPAAKSTKAIEKDF